MGRENCSRHHSGSRAAISDWLDRLLTQMERILEINALQEVTKALVEAGRERG